MESEIDRLRKKVENFPSPSSYNRLAELLHLEKADADAEVVCRKCIKEFPRNSQVYALLADIQLGQGKPNDAVASLKASLERDGRNYAAHRMYADLLAESRDVVGAINQLRQVLAFRPADPGVTKRIAELEALPKTTTSRIAKAPTTGRITTAKPPSPGTGSISKPASTTSTTNKSAVDPPSSIRPFSGSASGVKPTMPVGHGSSGSRPVPMTAAGSGIRRSAIDTLAIEAGVKGAVVVDPQGQVVMMRGLSGGKDEAVAAFAASVNAAIAEVAKIAGHPAPSSWVLGAEQGQVLTFRRDNGFAVVALAEASVRPAMLELRARQALIDLGAT